MRRHSSSFLRPPFPMPLRRVAAFLLVLCASAATAGAEVASVALDSAHTRVRFRTAFLGFTHVEGRFPKFNGTLRFDPEDLQHSAVEFNIDVAGIDTENDQRDKHLRSADFFDAEKYPQATFKSTRIERQGEGFVATGPLTLHGVTQEIAIPFKTTPWMTMPGWNAFKVGIAGSFEVDRLAFGIGMAPSYTMVYPNGIRWAPQNIPVDFETTWNRVKPSGRKLLAETIATSGIDAAVKKYQEFKQSGATDINMGERDINLLGYDLLNQGKTKDAITIFEMNAQTWPQSPNVWDSLGEAYLKAGDKKRAAEKYRKSLELDPNNKNAAEALEKLAGR